MENVTKELLKKRSRELRRDCTIAEKELWYFLRGREFFGCRFNRQFVVGHYIVDFICRRKKLIIELDGGQHQDNHLYDSQRTKYLNACGYRVLRFWNNDVLMRPQSVLEVIMKELRVELFPQ